MNIVKEVLDMFGIKVNEPFRVKKCKEDPAAGMYNRLSAIYCIDRCGCVYEIISNGLASSGDFTLLDLISGDYEPIPMPSITEDQLICIKYAILNKYTYLAIDSNHIAYATEDIPKFNEDGSFDIFGRHMAMPIYFNNLPPSNSAKQVLPLEYYTSYGFNLKGDRYYEAD